MGTGNDDRVVFDQVIGAVLSDMEHLARFPHAFLVFDIGFPYVGNGVGQGVPGVLDSGACLKRIAENQVRDEQQGRDDKKPELETVRYRLFLPADRTERIPPLPRQNLQRGGTAGHADPGKQDHRNGADAHDIDRHRHIFPVGDQDHIHVEHFHHRAENEAENRRRFFVLEQPYAQGSSQETGQAGGYAAGNAGIASDSKVGSGDETLDTTNETGQDSG